MPPHPLAPINEEGSWSQLVKEEKTSSTSGNVSVATSSSGIDDPDFNFDPESVDFEPLLVSGTGKILSYHSEDHIQHYHSGSYDEYDDDDDNTITSSTSAATSMSAVTTASSETNVVTNRGKKRRVSSRRRQRDTGDTSWLFPVKFRIAGALSLATFIYLRMLSRPQILPRVDSSNQMQTTVAKTIIPDVPPTIPAVRAAQEAATGSSYAANKPLFDAVKSNNFELTRLLLEGVSSTSKETNNNYDINCEDEKGMTPLIEATLVGNIELVKLLLSHGARAQPLPGFLHTPLRAACLTANLDLIRLLLDEGADPNAQSEGGRTPLMGACYLRPQFDALPNRSELSFAAVQVMLSHPIVLPMMRNDFGESALDLCRGRGYNESSQLIRNAMQERRKKSAESTNA